MDIKFGDTITLANNVKIPLLGFGTYKAKGAEAIDSVACALNNGYRLIDTAAFYANEGDVAKGIAASGLSREDVFITTKVWNTDRGYKTTLKAFNASLRALKTDYIDLYLIHWPANKMQFADDAELINADTWRALESLYIKRKVKAIGVCNFLEHHLDALYKTALIKPMVNQIELHPGFMRPELIDYCNKKKIVVEGWSPLGQGEILANEDLVKIAARRGKSPAQVVLNYELTKGIIPLPKSVTESRIIQNTDIFDFDLTPEEIEVLDNFPPCIGKHPDEVSF